MKYTTNYSLSQYDATDRVTRSTFNSDNSKIDAAIKNAANAAATAQSTANTAASAAATAQTAANGKSAIVVGTYTGNGAASQYISLGFAPKAVLVLYGGAAINEYIASGRHLYGGLALPNSPAQFSNRTVLSISGNGFYVYFNQTESSFLLKSNANSVVYHYLAIQ